jgi:hypothetical protein
VNVRRHARPLSLRLSVVAALLVSGLAIAAEPPAPASAAGVTPAQVVQKTKFVYVANADVYDFHPSGDYWTVQVVGIPANDTMASHVSENGQVIFLRQNEKDGTIQKLISESFRKRLQVVPPPPPP